MSDKNISKGIALLCFANVFLLILVGVVLAFTLFGCEDREYKREIKLKPITLRFDR